MRLKSLKLANPVPVGTRTIDFVKDQPDTQIEMVDAVVIKITCQVGDDARVTYTSLFNSVYWLPLEEEAAAKTTTPAKTAAAPKRGKAA